MGKLLLYTADTALIVTLEHIHQYILLRLHLLAVFGILQKLQDQRHTHVLAVERLAEIGSTGIVIHLHADLIHTRQRVQNPHGGLCREHLLCSQHIAVLQTLVFLRVIKALPLNAGHVQYIQLRNGILQGSSLPVFHAVFLQHLVLHIIGKLQFLGGDQHDLNIGIAAHGCDQRMNRSAIFQIAAATDRQVIQPAQFPVDGQQISQGLRGMAMAAVTGVDDRNSGCTGCHIGRTLLGMTHCHNVRIAADHLSSIRNAFALCCGGRTGFTEADHTAAQLQHCCFKAQSCAGRGLEKQCCQLLVGAGIPVLFRVLTNIAGSMQQIIQFLNREIYDVDQTSHAFAPFTAR